MILEPVLHELGLPRWSIGSVMRLLGLDRLEELYADALASHSEKPGALEFCRRALEILGVSYELPEADLRELRGFDGPLLFVANHPFGAVDALVLMLLMGNVRNRFKFIGNEILSILPEFSSVLIPVDIRDEGSRHGRNIGALREVLRELGDGGVVGVFPAGEVAAFDSWTAREPRELPWSPHIARLVTKSRATVVPVFFSGRNRLLFQYVSLALPSLRIPLLVREMIQHRKPVRFKLGTPIPFSELPATADPRLLSEHLHDRVRALRASEPA